MIYATAWKPFRGSEHRLKLLLNPKDYKDLWISCELNFNKLALKRLMLGNSFLK
jgi:hypothetical protein